MSFGPGSSPLQSMVYLALFVYGNALFFTQGPAVAGAVAWGFVSLSFLFLLIEIFRAWGQTRYQPVLKTFEETAVALGASAMYGGGGLYWILQAALG